MPDLSGEMMRDSLRQMTIRSVMISLALLGLLSGHAYAVPETAGVRITDVTPTSFSIVWLTDVPADPAVEVYADNAMTSQITDRLIVTPMPSGSLRISAAAKSKGLMKVRVSGLNPSTTYYVRTVTKDPANAQSLSYSILLEAVTASKVMPYLSLNGSLQSFSNDLLTFKVYIRPKDTDPEPALGDLIVLEQEGSFAPLSAFVGDSSNSAEGILDLNNLFGPDAISSDLLGNEKIVLMIYRAGGLSTLTHYRKAPQDMNMVNVVEPVKGFFADINLDGKVDDLDFDEFRKQYKTVPDDTTYNPDFNFVEDTEGKVDAREFSKFSREYGRTNVQ